MNKSIFSSKDITQSVDYINVDYGDFPSVVFIQTMNLYLS